MSWAFFARSGAFFIASAIFLRQFSEPPASRSSAINSGDNPSPEEAASASCGDNCGRRSARYSRNSCIVPRHGALPRCCAAALSVIERLDDALLNNVQEKSRYVFDTLADAKGIRSVSGLGLMIGIETEKPAGDVVRTCMERGVLCLTAKTKVRLLPALNIPMDTLKEAIDVIKAVCAE